MRATAVNLLLTAMVLAVAGAVAGAQGTPDLTGTWLARHSFRTSAKTHYDGAEAGRRHLHRLCTDAAKVVVAPEITNVAFKEGTLTSTSGVERHEHVHGAHLAEVEGDR